MNKKDQDPITGQAKKRPVRPAKPDPFSQAFPEDDSDDSELQLTSIDIETALDEFDSDEEELPPKEELQQITEQPREAEQKTGTGDHTVNTPEEKEAPSENPETSDSDTEASDSDGRSIFPYVVIGILSVSLIAFGVLSFMCLDRLAALQNKVSQMQATVKEITDSASVLEQKAQELKQLQEEEVTSNESQTVVSGELQGPQLPTAGESSTENQGTLSPSHSTGTFTNNTDESMDSLLSQIEPLLPQNNGTWAVYVCNLNRGSEGQIGGGQMQAASLIKLFIMGTVYENYESLAQLHGKETLDGYLRSMITVSDNDAANILVNWLGSGDDANGMAMVNNFCQAHGYTETSMGRLLLQSNENGDNYTSVRDCGRFLREIYQINVNAATDSTLSHADSMYYLLKCQERVNKIPAQLPEGVHVANKTGELSNVENDAGIIYDTAKGIDLVVCFMSENLADTAAAQASIATNARLIYGYYNE